MKQDAKRIAAREWLLLLCCVIATAALLPALLVAPLIVDRQPAPSAIAHAMQDLMADREFQRLTPDGRVEVFRRIAISRDPSFEKLNSFAQLRATGDALRWHHQGDHASLLRESYLDAYGSVPFYGLVLVPWLGVQVAGSGIWAYRTWRRPRSA